MAKSWQQPVTVDAWDLMGSIHKSIQADDFGAFVGGSFLKFTT